MDESCSIQTLPFSCIKMRNRYQNLLRNKSLIFGGHLKISSPICDAIICNNKSNHFISIQLFLTNTLKLTTLPVLRVGGATGARHIQMSARKNMQACFVLPEHYMAELLR